MRTLQRSLPLLAAGSLFCLSPVLLAQDSDQPQPPAGALLKAVPDYMEWVVTYSYPPPASTPAPPPSPNDQYRVKSITTTKTGSIIHEAIVNGLDQVTDRWFLGTTEYLHQAGTGLWQEAHPGPSNGLSYDGLPANGFRGLDWIGPASYVGIVQRGGNPYLVFTQSLTAGARKSTSADQYQDWDSYALVDLATRRPLEVKQLGAVLTYQFTALPGEKQTIPPDLAHVLQQARDIRARLDQLPPRPY